MNGPAELDAKLELELAELPPEEAAAFRDGRPSALADVARRLTEALDLISFFTAGDTEARAWTLRRGQTALEAAETIHSDIARGFIRAEVIRWDDLVRSARTRRLQRRVYSGSKARRMSSPTATSLTCASTSEPCRAAISAPTLGRRERHHRGCGETGQAGARTRRALGRAFPRQHRDRRSRQARGDQARARGADLPGPRPARGRPGHGEDRAGARDRADRRGGSRLAHPVHARPSAHGRDGAVDLRPEGTRLRVPARPDLRERRARRRDQPRDAEDAVGAARGDGRAAGDGRRGHADAPRPVPRARDAEPDRARGDVPAPGGAARPLPAQDGARLPGRRRRARHHPRPAARPPARAHGVGARRSTR